MVKGTYWGTLTAGGPHLVSGECLAPCLETYSAEKQVDPYSQLLAR